MTICQPCTQGDHCNSSGCFCQHRMPGTWKGVRMIAEIKTDPVPADVAARQLAAYVDAYSAGPQNIRRLPTPEEAARHLTVRMDVPPVPLTARPRVFVHQVADVDPALISGCNDQDDCCPDDVCKLDAARAALNLPQRTTARPMDSRDCSFGPPSEGLAAPVAAVTAEVVAAYPEDPTTASDGRLADLLARWTRNREASGS